MSCFLKEFFLKFLGFLCLEFLLPTCFLRSSNFLDVWVVSIICCFLSLSSLYPSSSCFLLINSLSIFMYVLTLSSNLSKQLENLSALLLIGLSSINSLNISLALTSGYSLSISLGVFKNVACMIYSHCDSCCDGRSSLFRVVFCISSFSVPLCILFDILPPSHGCSIFTSISFLIFCFSIHFAILPLNSPKLCFLIANFHICHT